MDPVRILQFGALDYGSACYLKFGMRPDLPRKDGVRDRLKRRDFLFLVASLLMDYGYPLDYVMHMVVERGTATMNQAEARTLFELSQGQIQVGYTSMEGQFVLAWEEAKSGNSDGKGPLESFHNLWHNYEASLPGQVGKDRDHSPAALYGSNREAIALNKAGLLLTPEQRAKIRSPYATWNEAFLQTIDIAGRINSRRDHELEGTDKVLLWRLKGSDMEWRPETELLNLDPAMHAHVQWLPVNESPRERALKLSNGVRVGHIPPGALVRFYEDSHTKANVNGVDVSVKIEGRVYHFGPETPEEAVADREEIFLHHAPVNPDYAIVTHKGVCVGVWKRRQVSRGNTDALGAEIRRKQIFLNTAVASVRGKMAERLQEEQRRMDSNIEVLADAGLVPSHTCETLASGKQVICTGLSEGMERATETFRSAAEAHKSRAAENSRLARTVGPAAIEDMLDAPTAQEPLPSPSSFESLSQEIPW